jgi:hypothetical protein
VFVFVNGFVAAEGVEPNVSQLKGKERTTGRQPTFSRAVLATGKFPKVARFVNMSAELPDDQAFERALNWIVDGMASEIEPRAGSYKAARAKTARLDSKKRRR